MFSIFFLAILLFQGNFCQTAVSTSVTYDSKALVIDGKRRILQSGSVHYPRTTPEVSWNLYFFLLIIVLRIQKMQSFSFSGILKVWPEIIRKAKEGGLDVIETYVFWNYHEPVRGEVYKLQFASNRSGWEYAHCRSYRTMLL